MDNQAVRKALLFIEGLAVMRPKEFPEAAAIAYGLRTEMAADKTLSTSTTVRHKDQIGDRVPSYESLQRMIHDEGGL